MLRRHDADYDLRATQSLGEIVGGGYRIRDGAAGKKLLIDVPLRDRFADVGFMGPQADAVRAFASEHDGEAGAPRASADDCDLAHFSPWLPKRFSVPANRRRMFSWCLAITSADAIAIGRSVKEPSLPRCRNESQANIGRLTAAAIDASDTYLDTSATITKIANAPRVARGSRTANAPTEVATPLPPRKCSHTGNMWPRIAQRATSDNGG